MEWYGTSSIIHPRFCMRHHVLQPVPRKVKTIGRSVETRILLLRGVRVILDSDLAALYGVTTRGLNQAVTRNRCRFPPDFAFTLTVSEAANLKSQSVTSSSHGGRRTLPRAFTEQGVAMLSSVLRSPRAVAVNVAIMRAFVRLRELALTHADLTRQIADLETKYDSRFRVVFDALRRLTVPPPANDSPRHRIGFVTDGVDGTGSARRTFPWRSRARVS